MRGIFQNFQKIQATSEKHKEQHHESRGIQNLPPSIAESAAQQAHAVMESHKLTNTQCVALAGVVQ